jgi:hypothetical protein
MQEMADGPQQQHRHIEHPGPGHKAQAEEEATRKMVVTPHEIDGIGAEVGKVLVGRHRHQ